MLTFAIKHFIKYGVHLGHYKWESDYRLSYFLLGIRNFVHIINIHYTLYALKKSLYIIYNNGLLNQRIFIINNTGYKVQLEYDKIKSLLSCYINNKWIGGLLTNQKTLYLNNENLFFTFYNLGYFSLLPSYVFVSNIEKSGSSIFEAVILNIPHSSMLDSNHGFFGFFYPFNGNDDSLTCFNLFNKILIKIILKSNFDKKKFFSLLKYKKKKIKKKIRFFKFYDRYKPYGFFLKRKFKYIYPLFNSNDFWYNYIKAFWKKTKRWKTNYNKFNRKFIINQILTITKKRFKNTFNKYKKYTNKNNINNINNINKYNNKNNINNINKYNNINNIYKYNNINNINKYNNINNINKYNNKYNNLNKYKKNKYNNFKKKKKY